MYKEPLASARTNRAMEQRIKQKIEATAEKIANPNLSDEKFNAALLDLCTLNRMRDSHKAEAETK